MVYFFNPEMRNFGLETYAIGVIYRWPDSFCPVRFCTFRNHAFQPIRVRVITELYYKSLYGRFLDLVCRIGYYK